MARSDTLPGIIQEHGWAPISLAPGRRHRRRAGAPDRGGGVGNPDAPLRGHAHVAGRCLPGAALGTALRLPGVHTEREFSPLLSAWAAGYSAAGARVRCTCYGLINIGLLRALVLTDRAPPIRMNAWLADSNSAPWTTERCLITQAIDAYVKHVMLWR